MYRTSLTDAEVKSIKGLLSEVVSQYDSAEDPMFLKECAIIAGDLPRRVRIFLNDFKYLEPPTGACVISGFPIDERKIGPTPDHWKSRSKVSPTLAEEVLFLLFGSLLGDAIGWSTQQGGYIMHDVLPIKAHEDAQISTGSQQTISWHNEDAFHAYRGDYVGLMCLRNPDRVPTTLASIGMIRMNPEVVKTLSEPHFVIHPDESHLKKFNSNGHGQISYEHIEQLNHNPPKQQILFGDPQSPYLRLDPYFMDTPSDAQASSALETLIRLIDESLIELVLEPGDCLFVDNYRAVHGRKPFKARYDGTDRWLKRLNITRDLRKSRDARSTCDSRIIS